MDNYFENENNNSIEKNVFDWNDDELGAILLKDSIGDENEIKGTVDDFIKKGLEIKLDFNEVEDPTDCSNSLSLDRKLQFMLSMKADKSGEKLSINSNTLKSNSHNQDDTTSDSSKNVNILFLKGKQAIEPLSSHVMKIFSKNNQTVLKSDHMNTLKDKIPDIVGIGSDVQLKKTQPNQDFGKTKNVDEIIKRILQNKPYYLNDIRSKEEKIQLLNAAIKSHSTTCILKVVLFLKETLTKDNFIKILQSEPKAIEEYIYFSKCTESDRQNEGLLNLLSKKQKILFCLENAFNESDIDKKISILKKLTRKYGDLNEYKYYLDYVQDYLNIIKTQNSLLETKKAINVENDSENTTLPFEPKYDDSLINTVGVLIHQQITVSKIPVSLQKTFKLSNKEFEWLLFKAYVDRNYFDTLKNIFLLNNNVNNAMNSMFKTKKLYSHIGFENIVHYLFINNVPQMIIEEYINFINDINVQIFTAEKYKLYDCIIKLCTMAKDKRLLLSKMETIQSEVFKQRALILLNDKNIKWKN